MPAHNGALILGQTLKVGGWYIIWLICLVKAGDHTANRLREAHLAEEGKECLFMACQPLLEHLGIAAWGSGAEKQAAGREGATVIAKAQTLPSL